MPKPMTQSDMARELLRVARDVELDGYILPTTTLGQTNMRPSILGLGGGGVIERPGREDEAFAVLERAQELGVNYLDTAWHYGNTVTGGTGESERRIGEFTEGQRDEFIIATKTPARDYDEAKQQIEDSLENLRTDHIDILQLHHVDGMDDWKKTQKTTLKAILEAQEEGMATHVGVTGHFAPESLRAAIKEDIFDTILMTLNAADVHHKSFIEGVLPTALRSGIGIIAMKMFCYGLIFNPDGITDVTEAVNYVYTLPIDMAIVGVDNVEQLDEDVAAVKNRRELTGSEMAELEDMTEKYHELALFYREGFEHMRPLFWSK